MGRAAFRVSSLVIAMAASSALADGTALKVVSRPDHGKASVAYNSSDGAAGLDKGAGTDAANVGASIYIAQDSNVTTFDLPAGAFDGTAGWTANDGERAVFRSRSAPAGPTGTRSF